MPGWVTRGRGGGLSGVSPAVRHPQSSSSQGGLGDGNGHGRGEAGDDSSERGGRGTLQCAEARRARTRG